MTVTVSTPDKVIMVAGGVDFAVDWGDSGEAPGLLVFDKDESDNTAKPIAYFAPGCWTAVVKTE